MNDLTPFESSVCALIEPHDSAHPTHSREVARAMGLRQTRQVRRAVESAIQKGALIGSVSIGRKGIEAGWFWIRTEADLDATCGDLRARAASLQARALALSCSWLAVAEGPSGTAQMALL